MQCQRRACKALRRLHQPHQRLDLDGLCVGGMEGTQARPFQPRDVRELGQRSDGFEVSDPGRQPGAIAVHQREVLLSVFSQVPLATSFQALPW